MAASSSSGVHGHHDDLHRRQQLLELGATFNAGEVGQLNIHQNDVRL